MERKVLGKGLGALISPGLEKEDRSVVCLDLEKIKPNRYQPRIRFKEDKLQELVDSIREKGVVQPILVRKNQAGEYELIAGERRLRAAKMLGHKEIPVVVKGVSDRELLELSIIENVQRDNLNPLEEATAYETLIKDFGFTQEQVAKSVGKDRTTVANMLRLLSLPDKVKDCLFKESITLGHAKAILSLHSEAQQLMLCEKIGKKGLSVREAERFAALEGVQHIHKGKKKDQHAEYLEEELRQIFCTKVTLIHGKKKGKIQIEYYSLDDLERILSILRKKQSLAG